MTYRQAKKVKVGDTLLIKNENYISTSVLDIEHDNDSNAIFFRCTNGLFYHDALSLPMSPDDLAKIFIKNPKTKVYIDYNNELGEWLYSVCVDKSDGFWLASFDTRQKAEDYIKSNNLKVLCSIKFEFKNSDGKRFYMFATDLDALIKHGVPINEVNGVFEFVKRGQNYGIRFVSR